MQTPYLPSSEEATLPGQYRTYKCTFAECVSLVYCALRHRKLRSSSNMNKLMVNCRSILTLAVIHYNLLCKHKTIRMILYYVIGSYWSKFNVHLKSLRSVPINLINMNLLYIYVQHVYCQNELVTFSNSTGERLNLYLLCNINILFLIFIFSGYLGR